MESIIIEISQRAYDGFVEAANGNSQTVEKLISDLAQNEGISYANILQVGQITPAAFMRRLTVEEYAAIDATAITDLVVSGLVDTLISRLSIDLTDPALEQGLRIIASRVNGFSADRIPELIHYDRPQPLVTE